MPNVAELIKDHVTLTVDSIDRVYLNGYVPSLYSSGGVVSLLRRRGATIPSPAPVPRGDAIVSLHCLDSREARWRSKSLSAP